MKYRKFYSDTYVVVGDKSKLISDNRILSIDEYHPPSFKSRYSTGYIQTGSESGTIVNGSLVSYRPLNSELGLNGENQVIGIIDTGVDYYHQFFYDPEHPVLEGVFPLTHRKIIGYINYAEILDGANGHGTHVSGIASGEALNPEDGISLYNGVSPKSKIFFVDIGDNNNSGTLSGTLDLMEILNGYSKTGVSISSNSWGFDAGPFNYTAYINPLTTIFDSISYLYNSLLLIFAAGNEGINELTFTLCSPSDSKNILSVAATTSTSLSTIEYIRKWILETPNNEKYDLNINSYGNDPWVTTLSSPMKKLCNISILIYNETTQYYNDTIVIVKNNENICNVIKNIENKNANAILLIPEVTLNNCNKVTIPIFTLLNDINFTSFNNISIYPLNNYTQKIERAYFSSVGPTYTGIYKPDISLPGYQIVSSRASSPDKKVPGPTNVKEALLTLSGTSMATPSLAGLTSLIHQYFEEGYYPHLQKDLQNKINPTSSLLRAIIINSAKPIDSELSGPNIYTGFGIPNISNSLLAPLRVLDNVEINSDDKHTYKLKVNNNNESLRVTMAYLDPPVSEESTQYLFANLDLLIISPTKKLYVGNGIANNQTEQMNTIERIIIPKEEVEIGEYIIIVQSNKFETSLLGSVFYSLVINGCFNHSDYNNNPIILPKVINDEKCEFECLNEGECENGKCKCKDDYFGVNCQSEFKSIKPDKEIQFTANPNMLNLLKVELDDDYDQYVPIISTEFVSEENVNGTFQICLSLDKPFKSLSDYYVVCGVPLQVPSLTTSVDIPIPDSGDLHDITIYMSIRLIYHSKINMRFKMILNRISPSGKSGNAKNTVALVVILIVVLLVACGAALLYMFVLKKKLKKEKKENKSDSSDERQTPLIDEAATQI
ncbi:Clan SB, family S8, subtilisin-like serine peptidase [Histomonas meleagridis]|uniref:Clan SB, family S8, subtilisin-like serine peptidase n=1 Tax=Histomonas meleagridis TaxID=135588 RepID=UPI00355A69DD|nr:Clan SB, family S8, subtilisin-like serine peptidase [Histomonas meleagridis]KAH0799007.1 Clan SB, family S8, subtilisin-like serine peptidase [Histomonas meleagridis]